MKVIAKTESGVLLEVSEYELGNIMGLYKGNTRGINIGTEVHICEAYCQLHELTYADGQLREAREKLEKVLKAIMPLDKIIAPLVTVAKAGKPKD